VNPCILHQSKVMMPRAPVISKINCLKVKYPLYCFESYICSIHYSAIRIKNCSKSTSVTKVTTVKRRKKQMVLRLSIIVWKWSIHYSSSMSLVSYLECFCYSVILSLSYTLWACSVLCYLFRNTTASWTCQSKNKS